jgi:hypothetical protein
MREQLNNNPLAQLGAVAVLLVVAAFFFISMTGGESESGESEAEISAPATESGLGVPAEGAEAGAVAGSPLEAVPPPTAKPPVEVLDAWKSGATVALLFVRDGGIDDTLVREATEQLSGFSGVTTFVVEASDLAKYSAITGGVGVERVPALVVMTPKDVAGNVLTASVHYGFQSSQAITQAIVDAGYKGPTLNYHP